MHKHAPWLILLILGLFLHGAAAALDAQQAQRPTYLPLVAKAQAAPTATPAPSAFTFPEGSVRLPGTCLDSAYPFPVPGQALGLWEITCYLVDAGANNGAWRMIWDTRSGAITLAERLSPPDPAYEVRELAAAEQAARASPRAIVLGDRLCSARVQQFHAPDGYNYALCFESETGRARALRVIRTGRAAS